MKKVITTLFVFLFIFSTNAYSKNDLYEKIDLFGEVLEKIKKDYVDDVDQAEPVPSSTVAVPAQNIPPAPALAAAEGLAVRVRAVEEAEEACLQAGVKWNKARHRQSEDRTVGKIISLVTDDTGVSVARVRWLQELGDRVDTVQMSFPVTALENADYLDSFERGIRMFKS